jgi:cofilin
MTVATLFVINFASFDAFIEEFPADDCRYAIYDMNFTTNDGRPANKLVSISW